MRYQCALTDTSRIGMDDTEFKTPTFQRVYQYLRRQAKGQNLDRFLFQGTTEGTVADCLSHFLKYVCIDLL